MAATVAWTFCIAVPRSAPGTLESRRPVTLIMLLQVFAQNLVLRRQLRDLRQRAQRRRVAAARIEDRVLNRIQRRRANRPAGGLAPCRAGH